MSPRGVGGMMEKIDAHRLKLWTFEGNEEPRSGCAGQAHEACPTPRAGTGAFKRLKYSVQQSYAKDARSVCKLSEH